MINNLIYQWKTHKSNLIPDNGLELRKLIVGGACRILNWMFVENNKNLIKKQLLLIIVLILKLQ